MGRTKDFAVVLQKKLANDPALAEGVATESVNTQIAIKVYEARTKARLTQKQLADRIGTQQSVISRIEDADYEGHSLALLSRIAKALGRSLRLDFDTPVASRRGKKAPAKKRPSKL